MGEIITTLVKFGKKYRIKTNLYSISIIQYAHLLFKNMNILHIIIWSINILYIFNENMNITYHQWITLLVLQTVEWRRQWKPGSYPFQISWHQIFIQLSPVTTLFRCSDFENTSSIAEHLWIFPSALSEIGYFYQYFVCLDCKKKYKKILEISDWR